MEIKKERVTFTLKIRLKNHRQTLLLKCSSSIKRNILHIILLMHIEQIQEYLSAKILVLSLNYFPLCQMQDMRASFFFCEPYFLFESSSLSILFTWMTNSACVWRHQWKQQKLAANAKRENMRLKVKINLNFLLLAVKLAAEREKRRKKNMKNYLISTFWLEQFDSHLENNFNLHWYAMMITEIVCIFNHAYGAINMNESN